MSFFKDLIFGKEAQTKQLPTMNPQQMALLQQLLGGLGAPLGQGLENISGLLSGSPEALQAYQAPIMRQFKESIIPGIAEKFSGGDAQGSSAFTNALGSAGAGLAENLAAQKAQLSQNALQQLMSLLGTGLGAQPFAYSQTPATNSPLAGLAGAFGQGLGLSFGGGLGGLTYDWLKNIGKPNGTEV